MGREGENRGRCRRERGPDGKGRQQGGYAHVLGQAAAMLVAFAAAFATELDHGPLPLAFHQVRPFAGPTVALFGVRQGPRGIVTGGGIRGQTTIGGLASDRGMVVTGTVAGAGEIGGARRGGDAQGRGLETPPTASTVCGHGNTPGFGGGSILHSGGDNGGGIGGGGSGDTFPAGHPMSGVCRTKGKGVRMVTGVGMGERTGER